MKARSQSCSTRTKHSRQPRHEQPNKKRKSRRDFSAARFYVPPLEDSSGIRSESSSCPLSFCTALLVERTARRKEFLSRGSGRSVGFPSCNLLSRILPVMPRFCLLIGGKIKSCQVDAGNARIRCAFCATGLVSCKCARRHQHPNCKKSRSGNFNHGE